MKETNQKTEAGGQRLYEPGKRLRRKTAEPAPPPRAVGTDEATRVGAPWSLEEGAVYTAEATFLFNRELNACRLFA